MEKFDKMDASLGVTLKDLQNSISRLVKTKQVSEAAKIVWVNRVTDKIDNPYKDIMPGSILLGLEWIDDGEIVEGTMRIEPPVVGSKYIN